MLVVPNEAALGWLQLIISAQDLLIHLYVNDVPLDADTVLGDFTECSAPGYAPVIATGWTSPAVVARRAQSTADPIQWLKEAGTPQQDIWGYYVTAGEYGPLLWAERGENPPYPFKAAGDPVWVYPRLSLRAEPRKIDTGL